jgi:acyl-coenzyme A thioesterase PaaI-like protein
MEKSTQRKFKQLIRSINWYPPYFFAGIKVIEYAEDFSSFKTQLKLTWYNKNLLGTAFGGSLYSMCDPFFMFILMIHLGEEYIVWDKHASIDFVKPGKGTVYAEFKLDKEQIENVRNKVNELGKFTFDFPCEVQDGAGQVIARLNKGVYVKKKDRKVGAK